MANQSSRGSRQTATPQNSAAMGVVLVVVAFVVGLLLLTKGGDDNSDSASETPAGQEVDEGTGTDDVTESTEPTASTTPPAQLQIIAANGSGVGGRAGATATLLNGLGYPNVQAVDGTTTATTQVYYLEGFVDDAAAVAANMGLPADRVVPMPATVPLDGAELGSATIIVLLGPEFDPENPPAATTG